jgi:hypothetical protein
MPTMLTCEQTLSGNPTIITQSGGERTIGYRACRGIVRVALHMCRLLG